jgi:hypothetical protein
MQCCSIKQSQEMYRERLEEINAFEREGDFEPRHAKRRVYTQVLMLPRFVDTDTRPTFLSL